MRLVAPQYNKTPRNPVPLEQPKVREPMTMQEQLAAIKAQMKGTQNDPREKKTSGR